MFYNITFKATNFLLYTFTIQYFLEKGVAGIFIQDSAINKIAWGKDSVSFKNSCKKTNYYIKDTL